MDQQPVTIDERAKELARENFLRGEAGKRAVSDPLPGPLATAFAPLPISVGDYVIRPIVAYDWAILKLTNSFVYLQMLEIMQDGEKAKTIEPKDSELWSLIYLLSRPCKEADKVFQKGADAFAQAAKEELAFNLDTFQISDLAAACMQQITNHMKTMVKHAQQQEEEKKQNGAPDFLSGNSPARQTG